MEVKKRTVPKGKITMHNQYMWLRLMMSSSRIMMLKSVAHSPAFCEALPVVSVSLLIKLLSIITFI